MNGWHRELSYDARMYELEWFFQSYNEKICPFDPKEHEHWVTRTLKELNEIHNDQIFE